MARLGENIIMQNGAALSAEVPGRCDWLGAGVNSTIHGQYTENVIRNHSFVYGISSQALLLSATGGGHPTIWNPLGSGFIFVPTALQLSFISGTTVIGGVNWAITTGAGAAKGIGLPIVTFTEVAATNTAVGRPGAASSQMKFAPTTNTFTVAPTFFASTGISVGAVAPTNGGGPFPVPVNGIVIYPGAALSLCYTVTTSTAVFAISIFGLELPIPVGGA